MRKIRVALIEDHELTRKGILRALGRASEIEVVGVASNAKDGLQMLLIAQPDIAIVDIGLPDQDGIELTRQLKAMQKADSGPLTKVLILTLRDNKETVVAALAAGADSYCTKDISFDDLLEAMHVTLRGNAWIDPQIARILRGKINYEQN